MRSLLALAALALALLAPAAPAQDLTNGHHEAGPCALDYSWIWPGDFTTLRCSAAGEEVVHASSGNRGAAGPYCYVYVLDNLLYACGAS